MFVIYLLSDNSNLMGFLSTINKDKTLPFFLKIENSLFPFSGVQFVTSLNPFNSPTLRGGVYFSEVESIKVTGFINDFSILPLLSKSMLGPNTEFKEIKISSEIISGDEKKKISFVTILTHFTQYPKKIELDMIMIRLDLD